MMKKIKFVAKKGPVLATKKTEPTDPGPGPCCGYTGP